MIKKMFQNSKKLFIPFVMAGHPNKQGSLDAIIALAQSGADIIEIGVPFSDPVADGPINQHAAEIALNNNINLRTIFELVAELRERDYKIPIILFSYLNPILSFGYEQFVQAAKKVGVNGVLIVDLPPEEGYEFYTLLKEAGLEIILLASPTTAYERLKLYRKLDAGFIYYISRLAVTGMQNDIASNLPVELQQLRSFLPNMKIAVGFGISTAEQAARVAKIADGVIIGSALVKTLDEQGLQSFTKLAVEFSKAIRDSV